MDSLKIANRQTRVLGPQPEKSNHLTFSAVSSAGHWWMSHWPCTPRVQDWSPAINRDTLRLVLNESKISRDLKITAAGAAAIQDAGFVLVVYLCCDRKALEEHFWLSCWVKTLDKWQLFLGRPFIHLLTFQTCVFALSTSSLHHCPKYWFSLLT